MHQEQKEDRLQCTKSRKKIDFNAPRAKGRKASMHQEQKEYRLQCIKSKKKTGFNAPRAGRIMMKENFYKNARRDIYILEK